MNYYDTDRGARSVLASLRSITPRRRTTSTEAMRVAELQAHRLLATWDVEQGPVPSEIVSELPRIKVVRADLPVSGASHWTGSHWLIALNASESRNRQRFTLLHEFKHIVDHGRTANLYAGNRRQTADEQAELAADYFAGCALIPRRLLKRAWCDGLQTSGRLARHFRVSPQAVEVRLFQTGLSRERDRCARPIRSRHGQQAFRAVTPRWSTA